MTLDLSEGNQVATPDEGKVYSKVTILKPETLIPENIKKDVVIAGVTGTMKGATNTLAKYILNDKPFDVSAEDLEGYTILQKDIFGTARDYGAKKVRHIELPNSMTSIGYEAFYHCSSLTSITIPNSVTSIGEYAFANTGLTSITIPDSVTSISAYTFSYCSSLTSITIPDSVTSIGDEAFRECAGLTSITIPNSVTSIGKNAFNACAGLTSITIPDSVISIDDYAFANCEGLTSITIPASVTTFGSVCFQNTHISSVVFEEGTTIPALGIKSWFKNVTIPNSVTSIGDYAFAETGFKSFTMPDSVTSIGNYAFYNALNLKTIEISANVTSIGDKAFGTTSGFWYKIVLRGSTPPTITSTTFVKDPGSIVVPAGCGDAYKAATGWSTYADKIVEAAAEA